MEGDSTDCKLPAGGRVYRGMLRCVRALVLLTVPAVAGDLPPAGRAALERDGVWVGEREFRLVFEAYCSPPGPVFVTSDGPIAAGYRLLESTVMRMDRWALERNVWTLHSAEVVSYFGGPKQLPGLVEPDPEVFAHLARMGRCVLSWMENTELDADG